MKDKTKRIIEEESPRDVLSEALEDKDIRDLTNRIMNGEDPRDVLEIQAPFSLPDPSTPKARKNLRTVKQTKRDEARIKIKNRNIRTKLDKVLSILNIKPMDIRSSSIQFETDPDKQYWTVEIEARNFDPGVRPREERNLWELRKYMRRNNIYSVKVNDDFTFLAE